MDKKIISLAEENKVTELVELLSTVENEEICQMIERKVLKGRNDTFTLVRAVLLGSPAESSGHNERRFMVYKQCITALQKNDMNNKMASELVGLLMLEADAFSGKYLAELASLFVDGIKSGNTHSGKALELFPKVLSAIAVQETISYGGNQMKGADYKGHVLNSLCSCKWEPNSVIHLAAMFRDVPLTSEELRFVIEKIVRLFRDVEMSDMPALVYQLLLLSTKGHKKLVLEGIMEFFTEMDVVQKPASSELELSEDLLDTGNNLETLRHTEGTVILHISFAVKQDQELGREFVKCLKANQLCSATKTLAPFSLALSLSLARIHRFEEQIYDFLKAMVVKSYKDKEKQEQSGWVKEIVHDKTNIDEYVLETVQNSTYGWDHVVQGLVQLGFILMDSYGPRGAFGRIDLVPSLQSGPTHQACQLGAKILLNTFKAHEMVRSEILEQIFNRVVTKATSPVTHYLELLGDTVYAAPQMLLESTNKVREMFDYLALLSPGSAEGLLHAVQPLLKLSMSLKDSLILVLRKAMFSRQLDSRKIGASGFLMILKHFKVLGGLRSSQASQPSFSSSQIQVDIHIPYNPSSNESLCLEILGNLRRCLSQQADVRLLLYQGLFDVLNRNTQLKDAILEMLLSQLKGYYESNEDVNPPLKLEPCILAQGEQVFLGEPLAHLLSCIQLCLAKSAEICAKQGAAEDDDTESGIQTQLEAVVESLIMRMITSEMEDFALDKSADYSLANSVGVRNNIFAILILGTYEVLMEHCYILGNMSEESITKVLQLFENYKKLSDILKEKVNAAAGKKGKSLAKAPLSLLSLKMVTLVLEAVIGESDEESVDTLRQNTDFLKYMLGVAIQKLQQIQEKGQCDGAEGKDKTKIFKYCCTIGSVLLSYYVKEQKADSEQRVREKHVLSQTLEGLVSLITIVTQRYKQDLVKFLTSLDQNNADLDGQPDNVKIYKYIRVFQKLVTNILNAEVDNQNMKDMTSLLNCIFLLSRSMTTDCEKFEQVQNWVQKLCTEKNIDDINLCKHLLTSLLSMTQRLRSSMHLLRDLAQDIHSQLGDIDQEIEVDNRTNFAMVTNRTVAPCVLTLVLQHCEKELDDTDWVIARVKADTLCSTPTQSGDESPGLTQREGHEKSICTRLGLIINAFHEIIQSMIPTGTCTETALKLLTRLYGTLTMLVKYYLTLYNQKLGSLTGRFEKLVKLSGTHLTQYCYAMITYIQASESEKIQHAAPEKGKKKKDDKKKAAAQPAKSNVMKQTRTIPNLIFAIEQYEKYLIQLTKKSKVNLMEHMKHSTSRDFRINVAALETLDNQSGTDEELSDSDEDQNDNTVQENADNEVARDSGSDGSDQENEAPDVTMETDEPPPKKGKLGTKGKKGPKVRN